MADETTPNDEQAPEEQPEAAAPAEEAPAAEAEETPAAEADAAPAEEAPAEEVVAEATVVSSDEATVGEEVVVEAEAGTDEVVEVAEVAAEADAKPREKPAIPGADLEVDIVLEGQDALDEERDPYADDEGEQPAAEGEEGEDVVPVEPIAAVIELAADARYRATGKRKTAVARVILKPGTGEYLVNGKPLNDFFPRPALQRTIRQPLEAVGYEERMDVVARMHGGGVSSQAGALRHGISRALLEADPNLRGALKSRGFLTRDARAKERKKAGLKKARKRPQFSKR
jgi:small subunit ribosomal protein S9